MILEKKLWTTNLDNFRFLSKNWTPSQYLNSRYMFFSNSMPFLIARFSLCVSTFFFIVAELLSFFLVNSRRHNFLPSFTFFTTRAHCGRSYFHLVSILYWYRGVQGSLEMWKIEKRSTILTKFKKKYFSLAFSEFQ